VNSYSCENLRSGVWEVSLDEVFFFFWSIEVNSIWQTVARLLLSVLTFLQCLWSILHIVHTHCTLCLF
jgi:hypothetical protein